MNAVLAATWRKRIDDCSASLLRPRQWCEQQGIAYTQYSYYRRQLARSGPQEPQPQNGRWLSVQIEEPACLPSTAKAGAITLHVAGLTLAVEAGFDPAVLRAVLEAMGGQSC
jgi:hypothetical protein